MAAVASSFDSRSSRNLEITKIKVGALHMPYTCPAGTSVGVQAPYTCPTHALPGALHMAYTLSRLNRYPTKQGTKRSPMFFFHGRSAELLFADWVTSNAPA